MILLHSDRLNLILNRRVNRLLTIRIYGICTGELTNQVPA